MPAKDGGTVAAALDSSVSFAIASIEPILVPAQLLENKTNKVILTKTLVAINTYSVKETNYYTNVVTQDYGKEEALHSLAYKIQLALGEYFAQHRP